MHPLRTLTELHVVVVPLDLLHLYGMGHNLAIFCDTRGTLDWIAKKSDEPTLSPYHSSFAPRSQST